MNKKQKNLLIRVLTSTVLVVLLIIFDSFFPNWYVKLFCYLIPYLIVGHDILRKAFKGIKNRQVFDESFLMTVATIAALSVGIYNAHNGLDDDYLEAIAVMLLYQVGELFQSYAIGKSRRNISELMDIRPDYANLVTDEGTVRTDADEVEIGSLIIVNPGEKIPLDGVITEGHSSIDTSALTGESLPRDISVGANVQSGCVNLSGVLTIKTTTEFDESTASKILDLVENAAARKSKSENFISKFARIYTPLVCYLALALAILPPIALILMGASPSFSTWIYRAATFLVISCPCAVVISIPLSFFAGLGGASHEGILIKGSNYLEALSHVKLIAFDKTGTITKGNFEVEGIYENTIPSDDFLFFAAHIESHSAHPISLSLRRAYGNTIDESIVSEIEEISGKGVTGRISGKTIAVGNDKLMEKLSITPAKSDKPGTLVHMAIDGAYAGYALIMDELKPTSKEAIKTLYESGISRAIMLTGDRAESASYTANLCGIKEYYYELLPSDKVDKVEQVLLNKKKGDLFAFVGDGINDAPVLSLADVGIAMGALGQDAAIEAADIVLMDDDPLKIAKAIRISKKCLGIVYANITFSLLVKAICLGLGAIGIANMWVAIIADVGVMILAVLNAIRALFVKNI